MGSLGNLNNGRSLRRLGCYILVRVDFHGFLRALPQRRYGILQCEANALNLAQPK